MSRMEAKKVVPLAIIFFCVLFNYTILRDTKDVLVVTAPKSGAEIIPFLKTYVNLPGAVGFTVLFAALSNRFSQPQLFRGIVTTFLSFFSLFATVLYPNRGALHPNALCDVLAAALPAAFAAPIAIVRNWTFSIFYMLAELWGSVVASLLFWGLANSVMTVAEAKRYYPLFGLFANIALVFSGQYVKLASSLRDAAAAAVVDPWAKSLELLIGGVVASGGILLAAHEYVQRKVVNDPNCVDASQLKKAKARTSMTVAESIKTLAANPYMREMATLVVSYGFAINIVEVSWKAKLKQQFSNPSAYAAFMVSCLVAAPGSIRVVSPLSIALIAGQFLFSDRSRHLYHDARWPPDSQQVQMDCCRRHSAVLSLPERALLLFAGLGASRVGAGHDYAGHDTTHVRGCSGRRTEHRVQIHKILAFRPV